jgi:hypothetical protein
MVNFRIKENKLIKVIVICPGGAATGGVELLHQLVDQLTSFGMDAYICYYPFNKKFNIPEQYKKYKCKIIDSGNVNKFNDTGIIPEVYSHLTYKFSPGKTYLWWMSVDNYIGSGKFLYAIKNLFLPWRFISIKDDAFKYKFAGHFYQSEYAKLFLEENGVNNNYMLSDYINEDYLLRSFRPPDRSRLNPPPPPPKPPPRLKPPSLGRSSLGLATETAIFRPSISDSFSSLIAV